MTPEEVQKDPLKFLDLLKTANDRITKLELELEQYKDQKPARVLKLVPTQKKDLNIDRELSEISPTCGYSGRCPNCGYEMSCDRCGFREEVDDDE